MAQSLEALRRQYKLLPNTINSPDKEAEWNTLARLFVQRFQQIHGMPHDSLAGAHSFAVLEASAALAPPKFPTHAEVQEYLKIRGR